MNAAAHNAGLDTRTLGAIEIGIMKDIGYANIEAPTSVPLPAAVWLFAGGVLSLIGFTRKRNSSALALA